MGPLIGGGGGVLMSHDNFYETAMLHILAVPDEILKRFMSHVAMDVVLLLCHY